MADTGNLGDPGLDLSLLREHFRDVARWVIGDGAGDRLTAGQADALAEELAVILASGLAPVLRREIDHQAEKSIAALQNGPVSFSHDRQLLVDGFPVSDLVKLLDAVGRLVEAGVGEAMSGLHDTHRRMLYSAHDSWRAKHGQPEA